MRATKLADLATDQKVRARRVLVQQRRIATGTYSASSGSAASGALRASLSRLSAASVALSGTMV
jgi:hypothetical protein